MNSLETRNLSVGYRLSKGRKRVLQSGLDIVLPYGKMTCLLGRNGIGKSTLIRTLAGLQAPLDGEILLEGKPLTAFSASERAQRIAVVLTDREADGMLTVQDVVALGRLPYTNFWGTLTDTDREFIESAMKMMGIVDMIDRLLVSLSDGERQKVMVAKAIAQGSSLMFLDEPMAFLDYPSKLELMETLHSIAAERNAAVLISTHDVDIAKRYGNEFWLIDEKKDLVITDNPQDVVNLF